MAFELVDPVAPMMSRLLTCALTRLDEYGVPVCRAFWHPSEAAPWDACCVVDGGAEGQLWVGFGSVFPTNNFPAPLAQPQRCRPAEMGLNVVLGILRCAHTVDDDGNAPSVAEVTEDALKTSRDRAILEQAILCCFINEDTDPGEFQLGTWEALGPNGGCVGGRWRMTIRVPLSRWTEIEE